MMVDGPQVGAPLNFPTPELLNVYRTIFVSKTGSDVNPGTDPARPKLTINDAMLAAAALVPTATDPVTVQIMDPGIYTEDVAASVQFVYLNGPQAKLVGSILMPPNFSVVLAEIEQSGAGTLTVVRTGAAGTAYIKLERLILNDTAIGLVAFGATQVLIAHVDQIFVEDGIAIADVTGMGGHIHFEVEDIYFTGTGAPLGIVRFGAGLSVGRVSHLLNLTPAVIASTGFSVFSGQIDADVLFIDSNMAWAVSAAAILALQVSNIDIASARVAAAGAIVQLNEAKVDNVAAVVAPGVADDYTLGYRIGSIWYDTALTDLYQCVDPAVGAAVWVLTS